MNQGDRGAGQNLVHPQVCDVGNGRMPPDPQSRNDQGHCRQQVQGSLPQHRHQNSNRQIEMNFDTETPKW